MHKSVLLQEVIEKLDLREGEIFVDATYGAGGHTQEIEKRLPEVRTISIDQDPEAKAKFTGNFRDLDKILEGIKPDAILFDLGFSSDQLVSIPGLSFQRDELLDMRLSRKGPTAADILNSYDEHAIELIIRGFGEERYSRAIARRTVERRKTKPFKRTPDLVEVVGGKRGRIHPATRTFQAIRIAVNDELTALEEGLAKGFEILKPEGRIAVISFHSLEDRIVKNFFRERTKEGRAELINNLPAGKAGKPIIPTEEEIISNPRSRSAKLRICRKLK